MAERSTIARPYANAAFSYAKADGQLSEWLSMLAVGALVTANEKVKPLLGNPRVEAGAIAKMVADVAAVQAVSMTNFLQILDEGGRLGLLPEISELFGQLYQTQQNRAEVVIDSAQPLAMPQLELIEKSLARRLNREVSVTVNIDETLMGGAVIRVGDQVIDGSVKGRLQQLAATLLQ